jgi:hypothetical protein
MQTDPETEQQTREMLRAAMRHELAELAALARADGGRMLAGAVSLCVQVCGYIVIDAAGMRWPGVARLEEIAHDASMAATGLDVSEGDLFDYLSHCVIGSDPPGEVFERAAAGTLPLLITANLLSTFRPKDIPWGEYLDQIWNAYNAAEVIDKSVLPALMYQVRKAATGS